MSQVIIQQIVSGPTAGNPFLGPTGKQVEVTEWVVSGIVDGVQDAAINLRAFSKKVHSAVRAGGMVVTDPPKTYQGRREYKVTTPSQQNGFVNSVPPQAQQQAPAQQAPAWTQPNQATPPVQQQSYARTGYNQEELEDLMMRAWQFALDTVKPDAKKSDLQPVASMAATYIIQASKEGIKIKHSVAPRTADTAVSQASPADKIWEIVFAKGLGERTTECNIPEDLLLEWWKACSQNEAAFLARLNYELKQIESIKGEEVE